MNLSRFVLGFAAISLATACAQDITDIDRTSPNKVHQSMFNGTCRRHRDQCADMAGLFEGIATDVEDSVEITESELRGWSTNETVIGMDQDR